MHVAGAAITLAASSSVLQRSVSAGAANASCRCS